MPAASTPDGRDRRVAAPDYRPPPWDGVLQGQREPPGAAPARLMALREGLALKDALSVQRQNMAWARQYGFPPTPRPSWGKRAELLKGALRLHRSAWARIRLAVAWRVGVLSAESYQEPDEEQTYQNWIERHDRLGPADFEMISMHLAATAFPHISAHVDLGADASHAETLMRGLVAQCYPSWNACLYVSPGVSPRFLDSVRAAATIDARLEVRVADGGGASTRRVGAGSAILVMDAGTVLRSHTFYGFAARALRAPHARVIYADEDLIDEAGVRRSPAFKPAFSPELNKRTAYLGSCALIAAEDEDASGFERHLASGGAVREWVARIADAMTVDQVAHIPHILFHRRAREPADRTAGEGAIRPRGGQVSVAIIIPTRNQTDLLKNCVASLQRTEWNRNKIEIIIIDNGSDDPAALEYLRELEGRGGAIRVLRDARPFNYARLNNEAARQTSAELLVFLNNDTEALTPTWLAEMAEAALAEDVAMVGAKLVYPDGTVQHGGVVLGIHGVAAHAHVGIGGEDGGYLGLANLTREMTAVTGACMAVRRRVFEQLGGFDEKLRVAFNDTALCLRAVQLGYRNLYLGRALFVHHESKTRGVDSSPEKLEVFRRESIYARESLPGMFDDDPSYNPNLSLREVYALGAPRVRQPWSAFRKAAHPLPRVLLLSSEHGVGHGVAVVVQIQAQYLASRGFEVFVGGPRAETERAHEGCHRVYLQWDFDAASFAAEAEIDCVIAHTMPFHAIVKLLGPSARSIIYHHGEPRPEWFPDQQERRRMDAGETRFCFRLASRVLTISDEIRDESGFEPARVLPAGNSHLATWDPARALSRAAVRERLGFAGAFVVLNVCRFNGRERQVKGLDLYMTLAREFRRVRPELTVRFVLCGTGSAEDRQAIEEAGLEVFAWPTDSELADIYGAADLYVSLSKWEGNNLGIGQALALGLPVMASDIAAHRKAGITVCDAVGEQVELLAKAASGHEEGAERRPQIFPWEEPLRALETTIMELCAGQPPA